jgi:DNA-binding IscR family transcriptional regulator
MVDTGIVSLERGSVGGERLNGAGDSIDDVDVTVVTQFSLVT